MQFCVPAALYLWGFLYDARSLNSVLQPLSFVLGRVACYFLMLQRKELKIWNISFKRKFEVCVKLSQTVRKRPHTMNKRCVSHCSGKKSLGNGSGLLFVPFLSVRKANQMNRAELVSCRGSRETVSNFQQLFSALSNTGQCEEQGGLRAAGNRLLRTSNAEE